MLDSDQKKRLTDIVEKLTAAMINEDVDAVKDYSKSLRTVYNAIYDSVYSWMARPFRACHLESSALKGASSLKV